MLYLFIASTRSWRNLLLSNRQWIKKEGLIKGSHKELSATWYRFLQDDAETKICREKKKKLGKLSEKDQSFKKKSQRSNLQEDTLLERPILAVLEVKAVPAFSDRSEDPWVWVVKLIQGLPLKRLKGQIMSILPNNETMDILLGQPLFQQWFHKSWNRKYGRISLLT